MQKDRWETPHTHTHLCSVCCSPCRGQVTVVMRSLWFKCLGCLSEHISPLPLLQLHALHHPHHHRGHHERRTVLPAHSVCLTNAAVADIVLNSPQDTFHVNFLCCMSITLTDSDGKKNKLWTQSIRPFCFKYSGSFSDASLNTKALICKYELFTHTSLFPSSQKQAC